MSSPGTSPSTDKAAFAINVQPSTPTQANNTSTTGGATASVPATASTSTFHPPPSPRSIPHAISNAPLCNFVDAMLTESAGLLMCYAHWKNGHHTDSSVFDLFFRQHPFYGEFTIFAGLEEVLRYMASWTLSDEDMSILERKFSEWDKSFFRWLRTVDMKEVRIYAVKEGSVVFPRLPLLRVEGPLGICQLLESTLIVLVNYASLIATNAARHRLAVGPEKTLLEFGLRRAQGPDGAMSASRYAYMGGFDGTSNVKAASVFGMEMRGTHAHSFVVSFYSLADIKEKTLVDKQGVRRDFVSTVLTYRGELKRMHTHEGELTAFISYAQAFPNGFLGLLDTFDTLESGIWNFVCVALALHEFGYRPLGIRLDSGDLAYLSRECRKIFRSIGEQYHIDYFPNLTIVASNDLSEKILYALKEQGHSIDTFGVGTNLVTCRNDPALGCVYKLVEVNKQPRMKVSSDTDKVTIPAEKEAYRLYNSSGEPVFDLLVQVGTSIPQPGKRILCRHPFDANKRVFVTPHSVELLHHLVWDGSRHAVPSLPSAAAGANATSSTTHSGRTSNVLDGYPSLKEVRDYVKSQLGKFREDHLRRLNPTPYKLGVSSDLYSFMSDLWLSETPIAEIM